MTENTNKTNEAVLKIACDIANLKISDAIKLIDVLCEKLGIPKESLCAASVSSSDSSSANDSSAQEQTEFTLILKSFGEKKLDIIKLVKEVNGLGLKESKDLVESCPKPIKEKLPKDECNTLKRRFEDAGATCEVK